MKAAHIEVVEYDSVKELLEAMSFLSGLPASVIKLASGAAIHPNSMAMGGYIIATAILPGCYTRIHRAWQHFEDGWDLYRYEALCELHGFTVSKGSEWTPELVAELI